MKTKTQISHFYKTFCLAEGNQHIASEFAVLKIQELVERFNVKSMLEVGLGIGAIAGSLLSVNKELSYIGTEDNDFCLRALRDNLKLAISRLKIHNNLNTLSREQKFELIIIDGKDPDLNLIKDLISIHGIIGVEGDRMPQQELLQELFPKNKYVHSISSKKNKDYSPFPSNHWQGGIKVIFINPTISQRLWWIKERVSTKLKYWFIR